MLKLKDESDAVFSYVCCRALFGSKGGECITTLAAWTVMCEEARSFGRALFDAEEVWLQHLVVKNPGDDF